MSREARGALAEEGGDTFGEVGGAARGEEGRLLGLKLIGEGRPRRAVEERPHAPVGPGRAGGEPLGQGVDRRVELGRRNDALDEAEAQGLGGVEGVGEERDLPRFSLADGARQPPVRPRSGEVPSRA